MRFSSCCRPSRIGPGANFLQSPCPVGRPWNKTVKLHARTLNILYRNDLSLRQLFNLQICGKDSSTRSYI